MVYDIDFISEQVLYCAKQGMKSDPQSMDQDYLSFKDFSMIVSCQAVE